MPRSTPEKSWLGAYVPVQLAEQFRKRAETTDRSAAQLLRRLIRREVEASNDDQG